ncbi:MAG: NAD(+)/NADH kinase [Clostridiales bacterium]|nr:NAD(+)/NADH kinase [Clostridiales bacterium]
MKNIGIYVNKNKDKDFLITKSIVECSKKYGFNCEIIVDSKSIDRHIVHEQDDGFLKDKDVIIVLGGDGTILRIAAAASKANIPLLSVNLGRLGFLTELELSEIENGLSKLSTGDFTIENRMMLSCNVLDKEYLALNDICLQRGNSARLLKFKAYTGDEFVDALSADGVLVSSPTGSTAYSLSAGGPVISPKLSLMLMTPICAHTLRARPVVFSDEEVLTFTTDDKCGFSVVCDGMNINTDDVVNEVKIKKSIYKLKFINFKQKSFFKRLQSKFVEWNFNKE